MDELPKRVCHGRQGFREWQTRVTSISLFHKTISDIREGVFATLPHSHVRGFRDLLGKHVGAFGAWTAFSRLHVLDRVPPLSILISK